MKNVKEIFTFGFAYSCVIGFCLFGPLMETIAGNRAFFNTIISLVAFIIAFLVPLIRIVNKKFFLRLMGLSILLLSVSTEIPNIQSFSVFMFAFTIATFCRSFTLHVLENLTVEESETTMAFSFLIAFLILYVINMLKPLINSDFALALIIILGSTAAFYYNKTIDEASLRKSNSKKISKKLFLPLISLYLVYIGGGVSYGGIYPYLRPYFYIDRYYNVLPFVLFVSLAGYIGKKYSNRIILFIGIIALSISFVFFMLPHTVGRYFAIQTFLQIGWAFTNVFGFSYSWRLADKYDNPYVFGYGIIFILFGVISGSVIANAIVINQLPIVYFGPFTFIPLIVGLAFQFFYSDINKTEIQKEYIGATKEEVICELEVLSSLSEREKEMIYHYYSGETAVSIASKLNVSPNTVRTHIKNAYSKLTISKKDELRNIINDALEN